MAKSISKRLDSYKINRLEENLGAFNVEITKTDLDLTNRSMPSKTIGNRY